MFVFFGFWCFLVFLGFYVLGLGLVSGGFSGFRLGFLGVLGGFSFLSF